MHQTETLSTPELRTGMLVNCWGMLCLIDRPMILSKAHRGDRTFYTDALVLNRDDVSGDLVPLSFTSTSDRPARGMPAEPEGSHRWSIQGNELARWSVLVHGPTRWTTSDACCHEWTHDRDDCEQDSPCPVCDKGPLTLKGYGLTCPDGHILSESDLTDTTTNEGA